MNGNLTLLPVLAGVAIAALVGAVALARRPRLAVAVLVVFDVANLNGVVDRHTGVSLFWPLLAVGVASIGVLARRGELRAPWSPVLTLGLLVLAVSGLAFAVNPIHDGQWAVMADRLVSFLFFGVVYVLVVSTRAWRLVAWTVVATLATICLLTVFHALVLGSQGDLFGLSDVKVTFTNGIAVERHGGTSADVNFWGRALLLWTPLALSAFAIMRGRRRWLWLVAFASLGGGIYLTQSRGTFLALVPAILCWFVVAGRRYTRLLVYAPLALLVVLPLTGTWNRLATIASVGAAPTAGGEDQSLIDRARQQRVGIEMFLDRPALGQGTGAFQAQFPAFDRFSNEYHLIVNPVGPHNFFIEQLAEGGVIGFTSWILFLGGAAFVSARTIIVCRGRGEPKDALFAVGILAGLTGWLTASLFLHLSDLRSLLAILALAAALDVDVRGRSAIDAGVAPTGASAEKGRAAVAAALMASLLLVAAGAASLLAARGPTWEASAVAPAITRSSPVDTDAAWANDLITRGQVAPTFAAYLERRDLLAQAVAATGVEPGDTQVTLLIPRSDGAVRIVVRGPDQDTVAALAPVVVARASAEIGLLLTPFVLDPPSSVTVDRAVPNPLVGAVLVVVGGLGLLATLVVWSRRYRARAERAVAESEGAGGDPRVAARASS